MTLVYKQRGTVLTGLSEYSSWEGPWPKGSIELYDDKVVFKAPPEKSAEIPLSDITSVKKLLHIPVFKWGFQLKHKSNVAPPYLVFWGFTLSKIFRFFESKNIKFEN
mgnify:CR=1 FL=1